MQRIVSYLRVSTTRQGQSGLGLDAQRQAVEAYVGRTRANLVSEYIEVESGKVKGRPVLIEAIAECRRRKCVLVVAKLDRLSRSVSFISTLMEGRVEFVALDAPYANKLLLHILAAFAEHEREQISSRTKAALAAAKARGVVLGVNGRVLGEQKRLEANQFAVRLRSKLTEIRSEGAQTLQAIADRLNADLLPSPAGRQWYPASVARVIRRMEEFS